MCLAANVTVEPPIYLAWFWMQGWNERLLSSENRHMTCLTFHHLEASTHKLQTLLILRWRKHAPICCAGRPVGDSRNAERAFFLLAGLRSSTTPGHPGTRAHAPVCIAFHLRNSVSTRDMNLYGAQWLAYVLPYRRFAAALTDDRARLGANVDRYSFIVSDFAPTTRCRSPAHCEKLWTLSKFTVPQGEIVEYDCLVPSRRECLGAMAADVAGPTL